jgi:hypothetical protein
MAVRQLTAEDASAYQTLRFRALQESPTAFSASYSEEVGRSASEIARRVTPAPDGLQCVFGAFVDERLAGILAFVRPQRAKLHHCAELFGMPVQYDKTTPEHLSFPGRLAGQRSRRCSAIHHGLSCQPRCAS